MRGGRGDLVEALVEALLAGEDMGRYLDSDHPEMPDREVRRASADHPVSVS